MEGIGIDFDLFIDEEASARGNEIRQRSEATKQLSWNELWMQKFFRLNQKRIQSILKI